MEIPLGLYLAQQLEDANPDDVGVKLLMYNAAGELRRQHETIKKLEAQIAKDKTK